ncbi:hypothetical protein N8843_10360 [Verrucomicrobia bacterium]|nr:hypothetical protein [Verrucomicrobiota bacterium]MDA7629027.1 hypothetical protein [Verrucomicrobiota bacterium]
MNFKYSPEDPKAKGGSGQNERHEKKDLQIHTWYLMPYPYPPMIVEGEKDPCDFFSQHLPTANVGRDY